MESTPFYRSSIGKKQIVAVTGLLLISFVVVHLAENLLIYAGPAIFNKYVTFLQGLRPGLYLVEFLLLLIFIVHIWFTALVVWENINARKNRYVVYQPRGERSLATRLMPYTGTAILAFVIWHLLDFTFIDHHGPRSMINGESLGVYGVVYNSFADPIHGGLYILAVTAVGFHFMHGVQSFFQTFGFRHPKYTPVIRVVSTMLGVLIAVGFSTIPVYVWLDSIK